MNNIPKLYKIHLRYTGGKDSVDVVEKYVVAYSDVQILNKLASNESNFIGASGTWLDRHKEDGPFKRYDQDGSLICEETYLERMLRIRGEYFEEHLDYSDRYYGIHHYGWSECQELTEQELHFLIKSGIAEDWRQVSLDIIA